MYMVSECHIGLWECIMFESDICFSMFIFIILQFNKSINKQIYNFKIFLIIDKGSIFEGCIFTNVFQKLRNERFAL